MKSKSVCHSGFVANLHGTGANSYWELLSNGVRVGTFTVHEISGIFSSCQGVLQYITSKRFGAVVIQASCITTEPKKILMILKKAVQTFEEFRCLKN